MARGKSRSQPIVRYARLEVLKVFEISEADLDKLEAGPSGQLQLNFALALLPTSLSILVAMLNARALAEMQQQPEFKAGIGDCKFDLVVARHPQAVGKPLVVVDVEHAPNLVEQDVLILLSLGRLLTGKGRSKRSSSMATRPCWRRGLRSEPQPSLSAGRSAAVVWSRRHNGMLSMDF